MPNSAPAAPRPAPGAGVVASTPTAGAPAVAAGVVGVLIVLAFGSVATHTDWSQHELPVVIWMSAHHTAAAGALATTLAAVLSPGTGLLWLALAGWLAARRWGVRYGVLIFLVGGANLAGAVAIKLLVGRPRPDVSALANPPAVDHSYSYPSGHTVVATVVVLCLIIALRPPRRRWGIPVGAAVVLLTAASRVYLGLHYPTDVLAAVLYALSAAPVLVGLLAAPPVRAVLTRLNLLPPPTVVDTEGGLP